MSSAFAFFSFHVFDTKGAFNLWELAGRTSQLANEIGFFHGFLLKNHLLRAYYLEFDWSGWIVLIKSEILVMTGMVWPVSSDKYKKRPKFSWASFCQWTTKDVKRCVMNLRRVESLEIVWIGDIHDNSVRTHHSHYTRNQRNCRNFENIYKSNELRNLVKLIRDHGIE